MCVSLSLPLCLGCDGCTEDFEVFRTMIGCAQSRPFPPLFLLWIKRRKRNFATDFSTVSTALIFFLSPLFLGILSPSLSLSPSPSLPLSLLFHHHLFCDPFFFFFLHSSLPLLLRMKREFAFNPCDFLAKESAIVFQSSFLSLSLLSPLSIFIPSSFPTNIHGSTKVFTRSPFLFIFIARSI